jgi:hypothetical protein
MSFRLWFYLCKLGAPLFFCVFLGITFWGHPDNSVLLSALLMVIVVLGICGAVIALLSLFGSFKMRCPFCPRSGPIGGSKKEGLWMNCPSCGLVHGSGPLKLRLIREQISE